jgi:TonB family protein
MTTIMALLQMLLETTIATTLAVLLVLVLRRPLRMMFGAAIAYAAWALVPVAAIAVLLPAATRPVMTMPIVQVMVAQPLAMPVPGSATAIDPRVWMGLAWLLGTLLAAVLFARQQRAFRRGLGPLHPRGDDLHQADGTAGLPAAIGFWKPAIVLPADFDTRYSTEQRALMLVHERMHIACGDLYANALTAALRCIFWFNPLLHVAARHFRHDQELACDQRVIARHPHARRAYGEAMFKTQLAMHPLPLGCHWGSHPLKERIVMLSKPVPTRARWIIGTALVVALSSLTALTAWAAQPPAAVSPPPAPPAPPVPANAPLPPLPPPAPPAALAKFAPTAIPPAAPQAPRPPLPPADVPDPRMPPPPYPPQALQQRIDGTVVLLIDVGADGKPTRVQVDHATPAGVFDAAAVDAAKRWTFEPSREHGKPVASRVRVPVRFEASAPATPPAAR